MYTGNIVSISVHVRVSPRLSPSGPLRIRHSSICPKAENMTRMSFSLHFLDTMPMNSFLSSTAERDEAWRKQAWWTMRDKRVGLNNVTAARDQCLISTSRPRHDSLFEALTSPSVLFSLFLFDLFFQWPESSLLPVICVCVYAQKMLHSGPPGFLFTISEDEEVTCLMWFYSEKKHCAISYFFLSLNDKDREPF